jgi:hypothetical protein
MHLCQINFLAPASRKKEKAPGWAMTCARKKHHLDCIFPRTARHSQCSHNIGRRRNLCYGQSCRAAKFLMQRSEHPNGLFAGLAEIHPLFLSQGDGVGTVVAVVAANRSPVVPSRPASAGRRVTFRESRALGKRMPGWCQGACTLSPVFDRLPMASAAASRASSAILKTLPSPRRDRGRFGLMRRFGHMMRLGPAADSTASDPPPKPLPVEGAPSRTCLTIH